MSDAVGLGHAYQWKRFEVKMGRIQEKYGFRIFHAKEFKARQGEFRAWGEPKRAKLLRDFSELVKSCLTEGMAVHLEHERFLNEYKSPPIPNKMRLDSHYGACFRVCMARMMRLLRDRGGRDTLHVVLERGHENAGDCERIFKEFKSMATQTMFSGLGTFELEDKSCLPLMLSDLLAAVYSTVRAQRAAGMIEPDAYLVEKPTKVGVLPLLSWRPALWSILKLTISFSGSRVSPYGDKTEIPGLDSSKWPSARAHRGQRLF